MRIRITAVFFLVAVLATGCASSFDRAWRNSPAQSDGIAGRWEGHWQSTRTRRSGKLRAIITPQTASRYDARFRAVYRWVLVAEYDVVLHVKQRGARSEFQGAADLGIWGRYETSGYATKKQFRAAYRSKFDHGTFTMQRVGQPVHPQ